ncbi:hypothetical protein [Streptomyces fagopyri]|uniref:hypothetical protein n=1 Tax=Streptomyces fagopyri TaxID=2662397 RepID=UPI0033E9841F
MNTIGVAIDTIPADSRTESLLGASQRPAIQLQDRSDELPSQKAELPRPGHAATGPVPDGVDRPLTVVRALLDPEGAGPGAPGDSVPGSVAPGPSRTRETAAPPTTE